MLPTLTHLCLSRILMPEPLEKLLKASPRLQLLVIPFVDPRLVLATYGEGLSDWETGARGGEDIWARAENFLARKRRKEIEANRYFLDDANKDPGGRVPEDTV
ncbi:hypothetical protein DFH09DRAFT_1367519 [Mycena vulgaris]|nr:hypothetical protein DFH09DRAFT_1367519 [Mycena vulgaris]